MIDSIGTFSIPVPPATASAQQVIGVGRASTAILEIENLGEKPLASFKVLFQTYPGGEWEEKLAKAEDFSTVGEYLLKLSGENPYSLKNQGKSVIHLNTKNTWAIQLVMVCEGTYTPRHVEEDSTKVLISAYGLLEEWGGSGTGSGSSSKQQSQTTIRLADNEATKPYFVVGKAPTTLKGFRMQVASNMTTSEDYWLLAFNQSEGVPSGIPQRLAQIPNGVPEGDGEDALNSFEEGLLFEGGLTLAISTSLTEYVPPATVELFVQAKFIGEPILPDNALVDAQTNPLVDNSGNVLVGS
ncbi:MAG TPA: hypothetical protein V6D33_12670 [Cyanophyceae cyanobacterium]